MNKADLRRKIQKNLESLSFDTLIEASASLRAHFEELLHSKRFEKDRDVILSFYPFGSEPQLELESMSSHANFRVAYPRVEDWKSRIMTARLARRDLPGQWEEFEIPSGPKLYQPASIQPEVRGGTLSIILVPGIAFTAEGGRLGRGAGFYDRFLASNPQSLRVGLAFDCQIVDSIPLDDHDQALDIILTESRVLSTNRFLEWQKHGKILDR